MAPLFAPIAPDDPPLAQHGITRDTALPALSGMNFSGFRRMRTLAILAALSLPTTPLHGQSPLETFASRLESKRAELIDIRRDIHRHPELSGQERRTAALVAQRLETLGYEVKTGIGGHGVTGILRGSSPGPLVAFRADMDAVRSNAEDPVDFDSENPGVRHICGHDLHTTIGLALAEGFAAIRSTLSGGVMLLFQPAEESARGARAMLADGVFAVDSPDAIYAYHIVPSPVGILATANVALMPGRDAVQVTVSGEGDLRDVATEARRVLMSVSTITSAQATRPQPPETFFGQIGPARRTGDGYRINGMYTTASPAARSFARHVLEDQLSALSTSRATVTLDYQPRVMAGVTNDPDLVQRANAAARSVPGVDSVAVITSITPAFSEDFGSFQEQVPGVMYFLGASNLERGWISMPHAPTFHADEEAIFVGARAMAAIILDRLAAR